MNLKFISKRSYRATLAILFGISVMSNYAYSETKQKIKYTASEKQTVSQVVKLQVLVETYGVDNNDKYPVNIDNLKSLKSDKVTSSGGIVTPSKIIIGNSIDYSEYEKVTDKQNLKNKIIYKPLNISGDKLSTSGYQIYFADEQGNLAKVKNEVFCEGTEGCGDDNIPKTTVNIDNFSDPDGFTDPKGYKYFAIRNMPNSDRKAESQKMIIRCLEELKKGNKTQQIYHNLIFSYNITGQDKKAHEAALNFVKDFPNSAEAYHQLSFEYQGENSIKMLEKAISLSPKNPSYRMDLAATYTHTKQYEKALKEYQRIKVENPYEFSDLDEQINKIAKILGK